MVLDTEGFDVVCTIGRVNFYADGTEDPVEAAFALIAKHGAEGEYSFPGPTSDIHVSVNYGPSGGVSKPAPNPKHKGSGFSQQV